MDSDKNHTKPEMSSQAKEAGKQHLKNLGYNNIAQLLRTKTIEDPAAASDDGTSNSTTPHHSINTDECTVFANMFLKLMFMNWQSKFTRFNQCIMVCNDLNPKDVKEFTIGEFLTCFALFIGAVVFSASGARLWDIKGDTKQCDKEWASIVQPPGYNDHIRLYRFKQFRMIIPKIYEQHYLADTDPWWRFKGAIDEFNLIQKVWHYFVLLLFFIKTSNLSFSLSIGVRNKFEYQDS